jgi:hypothetical protein
MPLVPSGWFPDLLARKMYYPCWESNRACPHFIEQSLFTEQNKPIAVIIAKDYNAVPSCNAEVSFWAGNIDYIPDELFACNSLPLC